MLELQGCSFEALNDPDLIEATLRQAAVLSNSTLLQYSSPQLEPCGVTAIALLAESHLSIHTWPEEGYAAVDAFTCGESVDPIAACEYIAVQMGAQAHHIMSIPRGQAMSPHQLKPGSPSKRSIAS